MTIKSIRVTALIQGGGMQQEIVECDNRKTHYAVYTRDEQGNLELVEKFQIDDGLGGPLRKRQMAMTLAAGLAITHQVTIEPMPK